MKCGERAYQYRKQRGRDLMGRSVYVGIQHEESKKSAWKADTQFSKKENNISNYIHPPYSKDVVEDQFRCNCRSLAEAFTCDGNLKEYKQTFHKHTSRRLAYHQLWNFLHCNPNQFACTQKVEEKFGNYEELLKWTKFVHYMLALLYLDPSLFCLFSFIFNFLYKKS